MDISEVWDWTKRIAGVIVTVLISLYVIRCISGMEIVSFLQYELYLDKLAKVIFA